MLLPIWAHTQFLPKYLGGKKPTQLRVKALAILNHLTANPEHATLLIRHNLAILLVQARYPAARARTATPARRAQPMPPSGMARHRAAADAQLVRRAAVRRGVGVSA